MVFDPTALPKDVLAKFNQTVKPQVEKVTRTIKPVERLATGGSIVISGLPKSVQAQVMAPVLNHALKELIENGDFDFLEGRCCAIAVRDRNLAWHIGFDGVRLLVNPELTPDVIISATVPAFLNLISRHADPDTLFFQRRLSIEGDVEMGLNVKNLLDALDEDALPAVWRNAMAALRQLLGMEATD
jgi:predicted lipid carrier protein YhbT